MRSFLVFLFLVVCLQQPALAGPPSCGSIVASSAKGLRSLALVRLPGPAISALNFTLGAAFYPMVGAMRAIRGTLNVLSGETRLTEIPKKIAATIKADLPIMAAYGAILLFAQSSTLSVSELDADTRPLIESKVDQNVYVINAFSDGSELHHLAEIRTRSPEEGFPNATYLVREDILPENFDGGTAKISAWGRVLLTLMRRVKSSGQRIDLLDLHFHGYQGEMVLFNNEHVANGTEFGDTGLNVNSVHLDKTYHHGNALQFAMREEHLSPDIFNPGAVIRVHGCTFGSGERGIAAARAIGRAHLSRNGGSVCFSNVAVMRDFPETLQNAVGLEPVYAGSLNAISRYSLAPISVLRLLMVSLEESTLPSLSLPMNRVQVLNIEQETPPDWSNIHLPSRQK
jgi:hypothetical protein